MKTEALEKRAELIAKATGRPIGPVWKKGADGKNHASVGALQIESGSRTYGRMWRLMEIVNDSGGESDLLSAQTAQELYDLMGAFLDGIESVRRVRNPSSRSVHTKKWDRCVRNVKRKGEAADPYAVCTASLGYRKSIKAKHRRENPVNGFLLSVKNTSTGQRAYYTGEEPEAFDSNKSRGKIYATAAHARAAAAMLQRDKHLKPGWRYAVVVASHVNPAPAPAEKLYTDFHGEPPKSVKEHVLPEFSEGLEIGPVAAITYDTIRDGKKIRFEHEFSKRAAPLLITNGRTLALTGGRYRFTDRGIVDREK